MEKPELPIKRLNIILLTMVIVLSAIMILMNYYTIKILSASRAYINGESQYSKGQKEASGRLITYIYQQNETDYASFQNEIKIPIGDRIAREALLSGNKHALAQSGFLQAKNNIEDIDDMIWLFDHFKDVGLFAKAISIWRDGDNLIEQLRQIGISAHKKINLKALTLTDKADLISSVKQVTTQLTIKERAFSDTLGIICRKVNFYVFVANIAIMLIIVIGAVLYTGRMIRNIDYSRKKIAIQNIYLTNVNKELDQLIYSVTHDLRSPLVSLSGLIELINMQTEITDVKEYTSIMELSIAKQNQFIEAILGSASRQNETLKDFCKLDFIVNDIIAQNHTILGDKKIEFIKELSVTDIFCDSTKLQAILNNLISNAVKYADINKSWPFVKIRSLITNSLLIIEVEDNGIGMSSKNKGKIFDKYFMAQKGKYSTGIGLYLVKNMILQMNGEIEVRSVSGEGSTFTLKIPYIV
jgi:signal transduction histidine kinase